MGTNFDWISPDGALAAHIGKRWGAGGGLCAFGMQGHRDTFESPLWSWRQWRTLILLPGARVRNEYGEDHEPLDFVIEVEETTPLNRRHQWQWMVDHGQPWLPQQSAAPPLDTYAEWLCPDGFSFTWSDFS